MDHNITALERAFELAKSGRYQTNSEIKKVLKSEGYSTAQVTGTVLMRQLRELMAENFKRGHSSRGEHSPPGS
ncbi:hypothetical protein [Pelagibacterium luteolum]|uniref:Uncharacterized protein n=1 Tax=Pelagibacterium luteolum TaxID=440168 RepID=A0A1G8ALH8_9HYPH|nr:hypothetical protein [Pelagibacterium luteolum]SDH21767.1 hypothetical protein SAMN04487974_1334 [Pelagibacterium luteolum]